MKIGASKTINNRRQGDALLTVTYLIHRYSAEEQATFEDKFGASDKTCGNPECGAALALQELTESERQAAITKSKSHTNGHSMFERVVVCQACGERANVRQRQAKLMSEWLADNVTDADWEDNAGMIPMDADSIYKRVPFEVMMEAFTMVAEDKSGKGSRAR